MIRSCPLALLAGVAAFPSPSTSDTLWLAPLDGETMVQLVRERPGGY